MTDTADIKALRYAAIKSKELSGIARYRKGQEAKRVFSEMLSEDLIISLLDQLEAERQRADDAERAGDNARSSRDLHHKVSAGLNERLIKAEAELAALKGDQVPVANPVLAYADSYRAMARGGSDFVPIWGVITDLVRNIAPLFTAPQNPVEHPDTRRMDWLCAHAVEVRDPQMYGSHAMFHAQQDSEEWDLPHHTTLREQVDAAIEAAGGLPIPQATLEAAPQKPCISKEKLCDWLEDNFDIDDSQRDAFAKCFAHHCNCIVKQDIE